MATFASGVPFRPDPTNVKKVGSAGHSPYFTRNDGTGYQYGMNFLAHVTTELQKVSPLLGLENFMKIWFNEHNQQTVTTEMLQKDLEKFGGVSLQQDFDQYVYKNEFAQNFQFFNRVNFKISKEELQKLQ